MVIVSLHAWIHNYMQADIRLPLYLPHIEMNYYISK